MNWIDETWPFMRHLKPDMSWWWNNDTSEIAVVGNSIYVRAHVAEAWGLCMDCRPANTGINDDEYIIRPYILNMPWWAE
jgi:hypothetical protein